MAFGRTDDRTSHDCKGWFVTDLIDCKTVARSSRPRYSAETAVPTTLLFFVFTLFSESAVTNFEKTLLELFTA
jgi:hypothetical protein